MASLLTAQQISGAEALRQGGFDTYARQFVCFRTPTLTIIDQNLDYQYSYGLQPEGVDETDHISYTVQSGMFSGVVQYDNILNKLFSNPQGSRQENFRVVMDNGFARLKVLKEDYDNYIKDSQNIQLDGYNFTIFRTPRSHGVFAPKYYTLYLQFQN